MVYVLKNRSFFFRKKCGYLIYVTKAFAMKSVDWVRSDYVFFFAVCFSACPSSIALSVSVCMSDCLYLCLYVSVRLPVCMCISLCLLAPDHGAASLLHCTLGDVQMRWCYTSKEKAKCDELAINLNAKLNMTGMNITASCVEAKDVNECMDKIKDKDADLVSLDGGHIILAGLCICISGCVCVCVCVCVRV